MSANEETPEPIIEAVTEAYAKGQARINISFQAGYDGAMGKKSDRLYQPTEAELEWERRGYLVGLIESGQLFDLLAELERKYDAAYMKHFNNAAYMRDHNFKLEEAAQLSLMYTFGEVRLDVWSALRKAKEMCGCD
jgi:hypothetical protein